MNVRQITIFLEDKPGTLHDVIETLTEKNIHIRSFTAVDMGGVTILRLIVDNIVYAASILKGMGLQTSFTDVFVADIPDTESGLVEVLDILKRADVNIQHVYPIMSKNTIRLSNAVHMVFEVSDNERAMIFLEQHEIRLLTQEELAAL